MDNLYDVIILGGGPAGCAAAVYSARKNLKTLLITEEFGGQSIVSNDIQNWIGEKHISGLEMSKKIEEHVRNFANNVEIRNPEVIKGITTKDCSTKTRFCDFEVSTSKGIYNGKSLILGLGAHRRKLQVPGEEQFVAKGIVYCSTCDAALFAGKKVAVIGGGNSGVEAVQDLFSYASEVYLLEYADSLRADPISIEEIKKNPKLKSILLNAQVIEVLGDTFVTGLKYLDRSTKQQHELPIEGIFVEIGSVPNTEFMKDLVQLDKYGQIMVSSTNGATSHPGIFAAGDITDAPYKQNNIAVGDAIKAVLAAYDYLMNRQVRGYTLPGV